MSTDNETHVSFNGALYRVTKVTDKEYLPHDAVFQGYGRLVNPNMFYTDAPYVGLYWSDKGAYALL